MYFIKQIVMYVRMYNNYYLLQSMVDGVHGHIDHAVRLVVVESNGELENVGILHLPVEVKIVLA